jgi:hypothetical protein
VTGAAVWGSRGAKGNERKGGESRQRSSVTSSSQPKSLQQRFLLTSAWEGAEGREGKDWGRGGMGGKEKKQEGLAQMAAHSFPPAQHLMISDIFQHTAEVEEEEKKSRGATKKNW